jgi:hypothetical protein
MKEKKARVEDAMHATRAAVEEGIVAGGGVTLVRASKVLNDLKLEDSDRLGSPVFLCASAPSAPRYRKVNVNSTVTSTDTGLPKRVPGTKRHWRTASIALASRPNVRSSERVMLT